MRTINLHRQDLKSIVDALAMAASRREAMDRAGIGRKRGVDHAGAAAKMRIIRVAIMLALKENPGERDFHMEPRP